jgi:ubiquitin-conjugating enzyme (huntingtin interacting protein 2)
MPPIRIKREVDNLKDNSEIRIISHNEDYTNIIAEITGPKDSVYENGKFKLDITINEEYPFEPPKIKFITKIWHPNISSVTGCICIDILKKDRWSPALSLFSVLISLQSLLNEPIPDDPQDAVVAGQLINTPELFYKTVKEWIELYAISS